MTNIKEVKYPNMGELDKIRGRSSALGYESPTDANLYKLGQSLYSSPSPRLSAETKLWRQLKDVRRRQAQWRSQERRQLKTGYRTTEGLTTSILKRAADIFVDLRERRCSYGDYVFNFAFPADIARSPLPIKIPRNLPKVIWKMAEYVEKPFPQGLPMARVDAIREADNSIKIIEINPCWVDNIGALQAFYETYQTTTFTEPVDILCQQIIARRPKNRKIALLYGTQADGCKRDEIFGLANYIRANGYFDQIAVSSLSPRFDTTDYGTIYVNGSFAMAQQYAGEQQMFEKFIQCQTQGQLLLLPAQFTALDDKKSLIGMSQTRPDIFVQTTSERNEVIGPAIAKPLQSESLRGIATIGQGENPELQEGCIYQPMTTRLSSSPLVCVNTQTKVISQPPELFEKINIWIIGNQIAGAIATYDTSYMINDAGYNLPIPWQET